jgi:hypothetical protein
MNCILWDKRVTRKIKQHIYKDNIKNVLYGSEVWHFKKKTKATGSRSGFLEEYQGKTKQRNRRKENGFT